MAFLRMAPSDTDKERQTATVHRTITLNCLFIATKTGFLLPSLSTSVDPHHSQTFLPDNKNDTFLLLQQYRQYFTLHDVSHILTPWKKENGNKRRKRDNWVLHHYLKLGDTCNLNWVISCSPDQVYLPTGSITLDGATFVCPVVNPFFFLPPPLLPKPVYNVCQKRAFPAARRSIRFKGVKRDGGRWLLSKHFFSYTFVGLDITLARRNELRKFAINRLITGSRKAPAYGNNI